MTDPDYEDTPSVHSIDFLGGCGDFITGMYPVYTVSPTNNATNPGVYSVEIVLIDDNPNPKTSSYSLSIRVVPQPPVNVQILALNQTTNSSN